MKQEYQVIAKKGEFLFDTLSIKYCKRINIFYNVRNILYTVFKENEIDKTNVQSLSITQKEKTVYIEVEYCKVNLKSLTKSKDKKEQIIATLNYLGYSLEKIIEISYREKWPKVANENKMVWEIKLEEHYYPDEIFSQRDHEISLSRELKKFLEIDISVSM